MADNTGAPHFIPYVEPTDLVREYPAADEASAFAVAAALDAIPVLAGIGSNVVQTVKTDTFTTTSRSYTSVTGLSATITPTSDTSKILVVASINGAISSSERPAMLRLSGGNSATYVGNADGVRTRAASTIYAMDIASSAFVGITFLDSPATASAVTYQVEMIVPGSGSGFVNLVQSDIDNAVRARNASSITLIEVAA